MKVQFLTKCNVRNFFGTKTLHATGSGPTQQYADVHKKLLRTNSRLLGLKFKKSFSV